MDTLFTLVFWKSTTERAVKSFAQALAACLAGGMTLWQVSWTAALGVSGMTALLSVLTSVASAPVGQHDSPSLVGAGGATAQVSAPRVPLDATVPAG